MGFREEFFFRQETQPLPRAIVTASNPERHELARLRKTLKETYESGSGRIDRGQDELRRELLYQSDWLASQISENNVRLVTGMETGSGEIVSAIQRVCDYLGGELVEMRWAIERHTRLSEQILKVLLHSLDNTSRQYFDQGVRCYEMGENELAKERFTRALEATHHVAAAPLASG